VIPLYGFLEGDTVGLLVLASEEDSIEELGRRLSASASVRVRPKRDLVVLHDGRVLPNGWTVRDAGLTALDRIDVVSRAREERSHSS
jgi:hypothetical protein